MVKLGEMSNDSSLESRRRRKRRRPGSGRKSSIQRIDEVLRSLQTIAGLSTEQEIISDSDCGGNKACAAEQQHGAVSEREQAFLEQSLLTTQHELVCAFKRVVDIKSRILVLDPSFEFEDMIDDLRYQMSEREAALRDERARRREAEQVLADVRWECRDPVIVPQILEGLAAAADNLSGQD